MNKLSVFALAGTSMALALSYQQQGTAPPQAQSPGAPGPQNADGAARGGANQPTSCNCEFASGFTATIAFPRFLFSG